MKYRRFLFSMRNKYIALRNINILKKFYWKTQTQTSGSKITDWYKPYLSWTWGTFQATSYWKKNL